VRWVASSGVVENKCQRGAIYVGLLKRFSEEKLSHTGRAKSNFVIMYIFDVSTTVATQKRRPSWEPLEIIWLGVSKEYVLVPAPL
jgi:hypothetical protein